MPWRSALPFVARSRASFRLRALPPGPGRLQLRSLRRSWPVSRSSRPAREPAPPVADPTIT
eukprot:8523267-Alexandrium_andersonii.AAC.1